MWHGIYIGTNCELYNKGALIMEWDSKGRKCMAQFDAIRLKESHGWHEFDKDDFINVRKLGEKKQNENNL
jgi:hypothetical protein